MNLAHSIQHTKNYLRRGVTPSGETKMDEGMYSIRSEDMDGTTIV
jgi:hypothetical protein